MAFTRKRFLQAAGLFTTAGLLPLKQFGALTNLQNTELNPWSANNEIVNDLRKAGYSLIPAPQQCNLTGKNILIDKSWTISVVNNKCQKAVQRLHDGAGEFCDLKFAASGNKKIILDLKPGNVKNTKIPEILQQQAYQLEIAPELIKISANAEAGLFYGVQSLLQLLRPSGDSFSLPTGKLTDWPDLELRIMHWDTKHHQDKLETLKRYLDWAAFFKVNAVAFEIYDKYEFPRHPVIGAPGAFTKSEMLELTAYAHDRFIELIPNVQAPAHMAYVLKHQEFAHLRADGNNYQACMCDEEAIQLIFDMFQDMIDATPGVKYFLVSTDEVYYAGICDKCKKEYNEENRSQAWVDFVKRANEWMQKRGRQVIAWVEYPLLAKHIHQLPSSLIDGALGDNTSSPHSNKDWVDKENNAGMKQLAYVSMQGSEELFPNYFGAINGDNQNDAPAKGRLKEAAVAIPNILSNGPHLKGTFAAAWDDNGLHNEAFWLGWITVMQYGWSIGKPSIEQSVADFMDVYYGYDAPDMLQTYQWLDEGARFYEEMWDRVPSTEVKRAYGN
ncbi:glycoside hydrolase family 20 zincin-like fold domain-containing protein, partial [Flavitalea sp.]|nr:glycoside hydrolase family 20 zincin-like fold domain-containing protein [Flavitalea sp.]